MVRYLSSASALLAIVSVLALSTPLAAQELVVTPYHDFAYVGGTGDPVVVIADLAATLPQPPLIYIAPPADQEGPFLKPHGLALFSANLALVSRGDNRDCCGAIDIIDTSQARRIDSFSISGYEGDGYGTLAANPAKTYLLVFSGQSNSNLYVVPAPFSATSTATAVALPSNGGTAQTRAIAFDNVTGRAYVGHASGISALDPPYTSIAFTIPLPPSHGTVRGRAVALSADGSTLASTIYVDAKVQVLHAPFSAASSPTQLTVNNAVALDGLAFTPDGSQLLVVDGNNTGTTAATMVYAISAPFDTNAVIQPLDTSETFEGFEDIDISADGQYAALSGSDEGGRPLYILRAPFTTAAVQAHVLPIPPLNNGYDYLGGRGTGTARFWSAPLTALPQLTTDTVVSLTEGDSGTSPLIIHVRLSRPSSQSVSVAYATMDGSLTAPLRYLATAGTLIFAPGETIKTVSVPVVGDTDYRGSGDFYMTFANPVNASLLGIGARVECDVVDNDGGAFIITNNSPLPDGFVGTPYSLTFGAQGSTSGYVNWGPINSNLPAGLSLDPATGVMSGIPTTAGVNIFAIVVANGAGTASTVRGYQITIGSDRIFANGFE